jgi:3-oxoacyl-[acyl-carrier-protein] synthase II
MAAGSPFVITGCGLISGLGSTLDQNRRALLEGRSAIRALAPGLKGSVAEDVSVEAFLYQRKALKFLDRRAVHALAAGMEAMNQAALDCSNPSPRRGISLAVGFASAGEKSLGDVFLDDPEQALNLRLGRSLNPFWLLGRLPNMPASHLSLQFRVQGPVWTCCQGKQALIDAMDGIENGQADVFLAGASEAWFCPSGLAGLSQKKAKVWGEASVLFVIESLKHAEHRGANFLRKISRQEILDSGEETELEEHLGFCGCAGPLLGMALDTRAEPI